MVVCLSSDVVAMRAAGSCVRNGDAVVLLLLLFSSATLSCLEAGEEHLPSAESLVTFADSERGLARELRDWATAAACLRHSRFLMALWHPLASTPDPATSEEEWSTILGALGHCKTPLHSCILRLTAIATLCNGTSRGGSKCERQRNPTALQILRKRAGLT